MLKPKIIADNKIPFMDGPLNERAEVKYFPGKDISNKLLMDAEGLITRTRTRCNNELLQNTSVKFIASATIGYDHIDTAYCKKAGIEWTNAPGCNSSSVEQYIVSALLYLGHLRNMDLGKKTLGIIGVGNVGSKVERAAGALGMRILRNDPPRARNEGVEGFTDLDELLGEADIITLHVPLNLEGRDKTWHMVDRPFIDRMKNGTILINTSRGGVVDEQALEKGLILGKISDAVLDVFENEPNINLELLEFLTIATPHIAGYSADGKANGTTAVVRAVSKFFKLGLDNWEPENVPMPENTELYMDASGGKIQRMLWELYRQTYDITRDDKRFRNDPESLEVLREEYPLRHEPTNYSVRVLNGDNNIFNRLEILGFSPTGDSCF